MKKIIECVPNISEGRDLKKVSLIAAAVIVPEVKLLDVSSDPDHNRSVITFAGEPRAVKWAAFELIKKASELIDMSGHKGKHPRMGAVDVCPFVPVSETDIEACVKISRQLGKMLEQIGLSGYYYGASASRPERKKLSDIRQGEYEALPLKLKDGEWKPDFGPTDFNPKFGCTVIGARKFLIAYNINLDSQNLDLANDISRIIRGSGGIRNIGTEKKRLPGIWPTVQAIGINLAKCGCVQVSINLTDYASVPLYLVFETVKRIAELMGIKVIGSEIVGVVPADALKGVPLSYLQLENFDPKKQIIEEALGL